MAQIIVNKAIVCGLCYKKAPDSDMAKLPCSKTRVSLLIAVTEISGVLYSRCVPSVSISSTVIAFVFL